MYSDVFCKVYNEFGWNYYPEAFGQQLLRWLEENQVRPANALDLGCGTGILCRILCDSGIRAEGMDYSDITRMREVWAEAQSILGTEVASISAN